MNILYFGTVCDLGSYEALLKNCAEKPSVAPIVFESALLRGFFQNGASVEVHSFPMIPPFSQSRLLKFGGNRENLSCGYSCRWLKTVNIPVLKQISRRMDAHRVIRRWAKANRDTGVIFTYSIPPFLVHDILSCARRYHIATAAIIPDLLRDMYMNETPDSWKAKLKNWYLKPAISVQEDYDGYIYLTKSMEKVVAPGKPYLVMEGIADPSEARISQRREPGPKAVMYAGLLCEKYGILNLLDGFCMSNLPDAELWLFGTGTAVPEIRRRMEQDNRIRYFGSVPREKILFYERKASLLVNPRDPEELFTQYSFPSKTIEYMLSGTPLLTTKLKGIPEEYFNYVFTALSNRPEDLAVGIRKALTCSEEDRLRMGAAAQQFIVEKKNAGAQGARILAFLEELTDSKKKVSNGEKG